MNTSERASRPDAITLKAIAWAACAVGAGIVAVWLPPEQLLLILGVGALIALTLYTPFALFAAMLVLAPLRTLVQTESPLRLPLDIGQMLLLAFVGVWVLHRSLYGRPIFQLRSTPWLVLPLAAFIAIGVASWLWTYQLSASIIESLKWLSILLVALFTYAHVGNGRWRLFAAAVVIAAVANALVGIYIFFGGSGADHLAIAGRFFRAFGTFGQPNPFGGFMGLALPLSLMLALNFFQHWTKHRAAVYALATIVSAIAVLLISAAIVMSWSRGAWLASAASIVVMLLLWPRTGWLRVGLLIALPVGGITLWTADLLPPAITERITSAATEYFAFDDVRGVDITSENYAVVERLAHWQAALNMAQAHPFGVGLGAFNAAYEEHRLLNWQQALGHAHNYYLNVLAEVGIIGLIAYLGTLATWFWGALKGFVHPSPLIRNLAIALVGSWTYLSIHSILDNLYVNNVFLHIGVLVGLSYWLYQQATSRSQMEKYGHGAAH